MKKIHQIILTLGIMCALLSCKKFLDAKPDESLAIPKTAKDMQALMDYYYTMNQSEPISGEASSDDYYLTDVDYNSLTRLDDKNFYTWERGNIYTSSNNDWNWQYKVVYFCNTVLTKAGEIDQNAELNNAVGQAYYYRGKCFYNLAQIFTKAYDKVTADADLGLPLRDDTDFNDASVRLNNSQTYQQIINDITHAIRLLPNEQITKYRPTKQAAYGLMARVHLTMGNFDLAYKYADSCLTLSHQLLDFNTLNQSTTYPLPILNVEILAQQTIPTTPALIDTKAKIPLALYNMYLPNDLRKMVYFRANTDGTYTFKGSYEGNASNFGGIAIDEIYLIKAETSIRSGRVAEGLSELNKLLIKRYKAGTFVPYVGLNESDALKIVLDERRKELLMRGLRWSDLKRLNLLGSNTTLNRIVNGKNYSLSPNSLRYALPIPEAIISLSGMQQNPY